MLDDQPVTLNTRSGPITGIPYTQECNDVAIMLIQHHKASEYYDRSVDQFDQLYKEGETTGRVMALCLHPFIINQPFRQKYLERALDHIAGHDGVWLTTSDEIASHYAEKYMG